MLARISQSSVLRKYIGRPYLRACIWAWMRWPAWLVSWHPFRALGAHLHALIRIRATRVQSVGTFFFRNRPQLELLTRLLARKEKGASLEVAVLGCSKGAEAFSVSCAIRSARPDLKVRLRAVDIDSDMLNFAQAGVYALAKSNGSGAPDSHFSGREETLASATFRGQDDASIFERMSPKEIETMFDSNGEFVKVKARFRERIVWQIGDARDPGLLEALGPQEIVLRIISYAM